MLFVKKFFALQNYKTWRFSCVSALCICSLVSVIVCFELTCHSEKGGEKIDAQGHNVCIYTFQIHQHFHGFVVKSLLFYRTPQWKQGLKFQICCLIWLPGGFLKCLSFGWCLDHLFVELFSGSLVTVGLGDSSSRAERAPTEWMAGALPCKPRWICLG